MIIHEKNKSIGYDTVNKCIAVADTYKNTTFKTLIAMAIKVLKDPKSKNIDLTKMENALLELAFGLKFPFSIFALSSCLRVLVECNILVTFFSVYHPIIAYV